MLIDFAFKIASIPFIPIKILRNHLPHPPLPPSKPKTSQDPKNPSPSTSNPTKMYVYLGKLNWKGAAVAEDETFIVILPNGAVRTGDTAYVFFQWTRDEYGVPKANWFQTISIDKVSKTDKGDDVFTLKHPKFSWKITSQQAYENIKITMSDCASHETSSTLNRVWGAHSHGDKANDTVRVWTGKINWSIFAKDEMAIFIAPEGFGQGRPIISLWQWTKNSAGKSKDPSLRCEYQNIQTENDDVVRFTYTSYYDLDCTFNRQTGKLSVRMKSPRDSSAKDLGDFTLAALIDRHSHDFNPPESTPNKEETDFRLPQPQPSLPRVLAPMPFPRTLLETLTHTAAFVDQAGYLAKYAEQEFRTLDTRFHQSERQLEAAQQKGNALDKEVKMLKQKIAVGEGVADELRKQLKDAEDKEMKMKRHDTKDHDEINNLVRERNNLKAEVSALKIKLVEIGENLGEEKKQRRRLEHEKDHLEDHCALLKKQKEKLRAEKGELEAKNKDLEKLQKTLQKDLQNTKDEVRSKTDALKKAERERDQAQSEIESKNLAINKAEEKANKAEKDFDVAARALKKAQEEIINLKKERSNHDELDKKHIVDDQKQNAEHLKEIGKIRREYEKKLKDADDKLKDALSEVQSLKTSQEEHAKKDQELAEQDMKTHQDYEDRYNSHLEKDKADAAVRDAAEQAALDEEQKRINDAQERLNARKAMQQPERQQNKGTMAV
ncbi:Myosin-6 [Colletotrichum sp. SAR11_239]|nr:Myosin-6 [Colletotrichum sp. SAR11_239]